jgi:hypothetical protein
MTAGEMADEQAEIGDSGVVVFPLRVAAVDIGSNAIRFAAGEGSLLLEQWALKKKGRMFERVFDRKLEPTIAAGR